MHVKLNLTVGVNPVLYLGSAPPLEISIQGMFMAEFIGLIPKRDSLI